MAEYTKIGEINTSLLSRAEVGFLRGTKDVSANYERVLLHRIFRKLNNFRDIVLPILASNPKTSMWTASITENCNRITDFSNNSCQSEKLGNRFVLQNSDENKWGCPDLNRGPESPSLRA